MVTTAAVGTPRRTVRGACYGFRVTSELPFTFLRGPTTGPDLSVVPPTGGGDPPAPRGPLLTVWRTTPGQPPDARLWEDGRPGRYQLRIAGAGCFLVDAGARRITLPASTEPLRREERLWGIPTLLCLLHSGHLPLHASAVRVGDAAVLLAGPSGAGKTTLAAAMLREGGELLTEDLSCIRPSDTTLLPGPAMLRLRHDVAPLVRVPNARVVGRDDDRLHLAVADAGGSPVPLAAILLLRPDDCRPRTTRVPPETALRDLWALSYHPPTEVEHQRCFDRITDLVAGVPVWNLHRRLESDALTATARAAAAVVADG